MLSIVSPRGIGDGIPILMSQTDTLLLYRYARRAPTQGWIVDLGTYMGGSAAVLCAACGDGRVVTIDNYTASPVTSVEITQANLQAAGLCPRVVEGDSRIIPSGIEQVALLCIDTVHSSWFLDQELDAWLPLLLPKGIVAIHDYGDKRFPTMREAVDARFGGDEWKGMAQGGLLVIFERMEGA